MKVVKTKTGFSVKFGTKVAARVFNVGGGQHILDTYVKEPYKHPEQILAFHDKGTREEITQKLHQRLAEGGWL